jgi:Calmodulin binding protein-like
LHAKCDAPIRVEVIDRATGQPVNEDIPGVTLELCILDGNAYDARCSERPGEDIGNDVDACTLVLNNKASALLVPGPGGSQSPDNKVIVPLVKGMAVLPDVHVTDSSEALLSGRKPPFRLLARAIKTSGNTPGGSSKSSQAPAAAMPNIRSAVSEGFVVATRRTRTAGKVDIPNVDDHVGKLEHMGRETVKKLQDIRGSAAAAGIDINVPDNAINRVGEFRKLALLAEADGHLRQKLQQVLKLSKEKWDEARDHAMRAVVADNRMRIWYANKGSMDVGLLFTCRLGSAELERPVGLLTKKGVDGAQTTMEATLMAQQTPQQREQVRALQPQATAAWWQHGHPGWAIYPVDSDQFLATGSLDPAAMPSGDQIAAAQQQQLVQQQQQQQQQASILGGAPYGYPGAAGFGPGAFLGNLPGGVPQTNEALLRALGSGSFVGAPGNAAAAAAAAGLAAGGAGPGAGGVPYGLGPMLPPTAPLGGVPGMPGSPTAATTSPFAIAGNQTVQQAMPPPPPRGNHHQQQSQQQQQQRQQQEGGQEKHQNGAAPASGNPQQPGQRAVVDRKASFPAPGTSPPGLEGAPSFTLANLHSMFGADFKLPFGLQNFPSLPGGGLLPGSGDLEALLAHAGGIDAARFPSLTFGKSIELLDGDLAPIGGGGGGGIKTEQGRGDGRTLRSGNNTSPPGGMQRKQSGLECMQSIEHALSDVAPHQPARPQSVHEAMDAAVEAMRAQQKSNGLAGNKRK